MPNIDLYAFSELKSTLKKLGFHIKSKEDYQIDTDDFETLFKAGRIEFTDEGIIVEGVDGYKHYAYAHRKEYSPHYDKKGKKTYPKAHIRKCQTIRTFIEREQYEEKYIISRTKYAKIINIQTQKTEKKILNICKHCLQEIQNDFKNIKTTSDFEKHYTPRTTDNGYTSDWIIVSENYRRGKNWKCEKCGIDLNRHRNLLHVHHKNRIKTDNREENLIALCVKCHANIDDRHRHNFYEKQKIQTTYWLQELEHIKQQQHKISQKD